jgi:hypothetical protein
MALHRATEYDQLHGIVIGSDIPIGMGVTPLGMIKSVSEPAPWADSTGAPCWRPRPATTPGPGACPAGVSRSALLRTS